MTITFEDILAATTRIKTLVHHTPIIKSARLTHQLGCDVFLKAEHLQKTGSFKVRGALNFALLHPADHYTSYSSGNHGQAVAWVAKHLQSRATIFVQEDVNPNQTTILESYGALIRRAGRTVEDRKTACHEFAKTEGATLIPELDDPAVIAGQGSLMIEVLEDLPSFDAAMIPVGGGGLLSGCAMVLDTLRPRVQVFACEPELNGKTQLSLESGHPVQVPSPKTIADGLCHRLFSESIWQILASRIDGSFACEEGEITAATVTLATHLKQVVEPSGAVGLACLQRHRQQFKAKRVVIILSGGNSDLRHFSPVS